jgi:hypothetical protein
VKEAPILIVNEIQLIHFKFLQVLLFCVFFSFDDLSMHVCKHQRVFQKLNKEQYGQIIPVLFFKIIPR